MGAPVFIWSRPAIISSVVVHCTVSYHRVIVPSYHHIVPFSRRDTCDGNHSTPEPGHPTPICTQCAHARDRRHGIDDPVLGQNVCVGALIQLEKKTDAHVNMSPRLSRSGVCKKKKHPDDPIPRLQKKKKGNHVSCINAPKDRDERYVHTNAWYDRILGYGRRHRSDIPSDRGVRWDQGRHASATGLSYRPKAMFKHCHCHLSVVRPMGRGTSKKKKTQYAPATTASEKRHVVRDH